MDEMVRAFLTQDAIKNGYGTDDDTLIELLTDAKEIWEGDYDRHRWWVESTRVVQVTSEEGYRYFSFRWATSDAGGEFDPSTIHEVVPVTKMVEVTEYITKK